MLLFQIYNIKSRMKNLLDSYLAKTKAGKTDYKKGGKQKQ